MKLHSNSNSKVSSVLVDISWQKYFAHNRLEGKKVQKVLLICLMKIRSLAHGAHIIGEAHWSAVYTNRASPVDPGNKKGSKISPIT